MRGRAAPAGFPGAPPPATALTQVRPGSLVGLDRARRREFYAGPQAREARSRTGGIPMQVSPSDLHAIPLFQNITEAHLTELMAAFERLTLGADHVLFEAGSAPEHFLLLVSGEVALREGTETRFRLTPLAPIGERGPLSGLTRSTTAVTTQPSEVYRIRVEALKAFFEKHGD